MDAKSLAAELGAVQVIDVREPFEWEAGRIEGARHIPMRELAARVGEIDRGKPVVAVCFGGGRSAHAAQYLLSQGFDVANLDGGLKSWVSAGLPLSADAGSPGRLIHDPPPPGQSPRAENDRSPAALAGEADGTKNGSQPLEEGRLSPELENLKDTFIEVVFAAQERFGDREPSEEEMRAFMKEWLLSKGKTDEEADQILDG